MTYPFVLSWSMLEAMSCGCALVASATPPVQEVLREGENGLLVDFYDTERLAERIEELLSEKNLRQKIAANARKTIISHYDLERLLGQHMHLIQHVANGSGTLY